LISLDLSLLVDATLSSLLSNFLNFSFFFGERLRGAVGHEYLEDLFMGVRILKKLRRENGREVLRREELWRDCRETCGKY